MLARAKQIPSASGRRRPRRPALRLPGHRQTHIDHWPHAYHDHFRAHRRERQFISSGGFFLTFAATRAITHAIKAGKGPFHNIGGDGGTHVHHMTFGIIGNLVVGYLWVLQVGTRRHPSPAVSRITSLLYGAGAALTLDEFALWLNLEDDYWTDRGRESIDAVVLFGTVLSLGALGGGVIQRYLLRMRKRHHHSRESAALVIGFQERQRRLREVLLG